jgi:acyl-CoA thioesterase-1
MKQNLSQMIDLCQEANAVPILFGMRIPPNYGRRYTDAFAKVYVQLSVEKSITLIPFQLEELAITQGMIQQDGLHPTEKAQPIIKEVVKASLYGVFNTNLENNQVISGLQ